MKHELWPYLTPGIPDTMFQRGEVPMTKEEIRVLTLAKARLAQGQVVWDVGAGTGSLSVEAARLVTGGTVYAVERDARGLELIVRNSRRFGLDNVVPVAGEAPEALDQLPAPHRVLIGGSGGRLEEILALARQRLRAGGRIVVNSVTLETSALLAVQPPGWHCETVQLQVSRAIPAGHVHLWRAQNPVSIHTLERTTGQPG